MSRAQFCAFMGFLMLSAAPVDAGEAMFSIENRIGGDTNIFRRAKGEVDDGFWEVSPRIRIREQREELNYDFSYSPTYQTFFETSGVDGWDHGGKANLVWRVTPRDSIGIVGRISEGRQIRQEQIDVVGSSAPVLDESDRERIRRAHATIFYSRFLTPRLRGRINASFDDIDFNSLRNIDTRSYGGSASGTYSYSPQTNIGINASGRYRENRAVGFQTGSTSTVGTVAATFEHEFMRGFNLSLQIGPSIIRTDEDDATGVTRPLYDIVEVTPTSGSARIIETAPSASSVCGPLLAFSVCPLDIYAGQTPPANPLVTLPAPAGGRGESETDTFLFVEARIVKQWRLANLEVSYLRTESANTGAGSSSIVDSVVARVMVREAGRWRLTLRGEWSERGVISDVRGTFIVASPGVPVALNPQFSFAQADRLTTIVTRDANSSSETLWRLSLYGDHNLTRRLLVVGRLDFTRIDRERGGASSETNSVLGFVGLRYEFEPIIF